jgi:hypothetical protein
VKDPGTISEPHDGALTYDVQEPSEKVSGPKPSCPYYPDRDSGLACPYYLIARTGMGGEKVNWAGMASLILGILCVCLCWLSLVAFLAVAFVVASVLTVVFAGLGLFFSRKHGSGRLSSVAGLVLGIIGLVMSVLFDILSVLWSD